MKQKVIRVVTYDGSFNLIKGQLKFLKSKFNVIGVSSNGFNTEDTKKREGIHIECIEMERQIHLTKDLKALYKLYKFFKKEKPYIVHSMTPKAGLLSMTAAYLAKVPHRVHTFTGLIFPTKEGWMKRLLIITDRFLCRCATKIFPEGNGVKNDLINYKITNKPLEVIGNGNVNGIDTEKFSLKHFDEKTKKNKREQLGIKENDFVFLFAGRMVKDKGINELIDAFLKIDEAYNNVKLLILGVFEDELDPVKSATKKAILNNKNIITTDWVDDVRPYMAISNILTFPSYREGFPNVVIQAGAMGLPAIVTDINGSNEIIIEGENGTIIPSKNASELYNKMLLAYNKELSFDSLKCRQLIVSRYEQQFLWNAILKEYTNL